MQYTHTRTKPCCSTSKSRGWGQTNQNSYHDKKQNYKAEAKYFGIYWAVAASLVTSGTSRQTTRHTGDSRSIATISRIIAERSVAAPTNLSPELCCDHYMYIHRALHGEAAVSAADTCCWMTRGGWLAGWSLRTNGRSLPQHGTLLLRLSSS